MVQLVHGRYEPLEIVGRGGQGVVIRALDRRTCRHVALKLRTFPSGREQEALGEGEILLGLEPHALLPMAREHFFHDGQYCVVMDWVDGTSLEEQLLRRGGSGLPVGDVLKYLRDVAEALDRLHAHDPPVVHGDVKPANIILTSGRCVLVDFGIASQGSSRPSSPWGTAGYAPPEVMRGERLPASDVFSFAATACALLTGKPPGPRSSPDWRRIAGERARAVEAAVRRCLAFDPAARPRSASQLVEVLAGGHVTPTNLPRQLTSFVGREIQMAAIRALLEPGVVVTLTGAGGVGKSRLALEVAADVLEEATDGVFFVELAPLSDPALVPQRLLSAVNVLAEPGADPLEVLVAHLDGRQALLVLDNCERVVSGCGAVVDALLDRCPTVRVLTTSRQVLGGPRERVVTVPPLGMPDELEEDAHAVGRSESARLFMERATATDRRLELTDTNAVAVARICRGVEGSPLALELAAARVASLSIEQIAKGLDDRLGLLDRQARPVLSRHQTLVAALDWSYDLLSAAQRRMLSRVAVFAGGFTPEAAATVCSLGDERPEEVTAALDALAAGSLLSNDEPRGRYRLLETIRDYSRLRLEQSGEAATMRDRHLRWSIGLLAGLDAEEGDAVPLAVLTAEQDNLRAALDWAAESGQAEAGLQIAVRLWSYWQMRNPDEGRRSLRRMVDLSDIATPLRTEALTSLGHLSLLQGDYGTARSLLSNAVAAARELDDPARLAQAALNLGMTAQFQGDLVFAAECLEESVSLSQGLGDALGAASALEWWGNLKVLEDDHLAAASLLSEALQLFDDLDDRHDAARVRGSLAELARAHGDYGVARSLLEARLAVNREMGDKTCLSQALLYMARLERAQGDFRAAALLLDESVALACELSQLPAIEQCLGELAGVAVAERRFEDAVRLFGATRAVQERLGRTLAPSLRAQRQHELGLAREGLSDDVFTTAWTEGYDGALEDPTTHARNNLIQRVGSRLR